MGGDVVEQVRAVATRVAAGLGLEIFDVQFRREGGGMVLRIHIDRPGTGGDRRGQRQRRRLRAASAAI